MFDRRDALGKGEEAGHRIGLRHKVEHWRGHLFLAQKQPGRLVAKQRRSKGEADHPAGGGTATTAATTALLLLALDEDLCGDDGSDGTAQRVAAQHKLLTSEPRSGQHSLERSIVVIWTAIAPYCSVQSTILLLQQY